MKIAIHHREGSFSDRWIEYCKQNNINFVLVDAYRSDIIQQLEGCDAFLWHYTHYDVEDVLLGGNLFSALEYMNIKIFPNHYTAWHYDNKLAQKYLFEANKLPMVKTYVFFHKDKALEWVKTTSFPKVFKLTRGAGSANVKLVRSESQARRFVHKAFGKGFSQFDSWGYVKDKFNKYKEGKVPFLDIPKSLGRLLISTEFAKKFHKEKDYVYFQDFIPNNDFDIRIVVIGDKAFGIKRMVRKNDFRASGGGSLHYEKENFDEKTLRLAFKAIDALKSQCAAFDFVYDQNLKPLIVEISFAFAYKAYDKCVGYWDKQLNWYPGNFNPQYWIIENLINSIND
ncbi:MAG: hypothetical protein U1C58_09775 [Flavobacteriaceae bacterium]|nr:hypothetical protein [Flavobacteriaceae bacterium]